MAIAGINSRMPGGAVRTLRCWRGVGSVNTYARVFFCQAEDGIRDYKVTGVQTCALPISPHIAAHRECRSIDRRGLRRAVSELARRANWLVVEGVGGFRVPLGADWDSADLAHDLGLPVVMVVGMRLGCLSHALLTAHAVRARVASCRLGGQWHRCGDVPFRGESRHPT